MANDSEITKVRIIIRHFLWQTRDVVKSAEESQKWLSKFRNTLEFQELEENPNAYALAIIAEARSFNNMQQRKQQMRWVKASLDKEGVKNPTEEQLSERWMEMYGSENCEVEKDTKPASDNVLPKLGEEKKRTGGNSLPPVRNSRPQPMPDNKQTVIDFAYAEGLDINDAYECWCCTINDRNGKDADGKPVNNWKAYVRQWCKTREGNRVKKQER